MTVVGSTASLTDGRLSDAGRLRRVADTGLTASLPSLDRLARAAAHQLRAPYAQVSLIAADRRIVAGQAGPSLAHTFCRLVLDTDTPLMIGDARTDERVSGHPAVADGVVAYAGFPLHSIDGYVLGAFCVIDSRPREWEPRDLLLVEDLAAAVSSELALRAELHRARRGTMSGMATVFTKIINGELPGRIVYSDEQVAAFLTIAPLTTGHTLVVPRAEIDEWTDLDADLVGHLMAVSHRIGAAQKRAFGAPRVGLIVAGFEVPHAHVHVFPAWEMADFDFARVQTDVPAEELDAAHKRLQDALA